MHAWGRNTVDLDRNLAKTRSVDEYPLKLSISSSLCNLMLFLFYSRYWIICRPNLLNDIKTRFYCNLILAGNFFGKFLPVRADTSALR